MSVSFASVLRVTIATVDRAAGHGSKWDTRGCAALRARRIEHFALPRRPISVHIAARPPASTVGARSVAAAPIRAACLTSLAARFATLWDLLEPFALVEFLLSGREDKILSAIGALQRFVLKFHAIPSVSGP